MSRLLTRLRALLAAGCLLLLWVATGGGGALAPALSAAPPARVLPLPGFVFTVAGHEAFLIRPENGAVRGWVWYTPTLPGLPGPEERWMFERFLAAGLAIGGVDAGESYGSPEGNRIFDAFYAEMLRRHGLSRRPVFLARSRGGLMALSWSADHPRSVAGIAGIYPVCDLTSYPGVEKAAPAYHLDAAGLSNRLDRLNLVNRLRPLARAKVPLYLLHGDIDTLVPLASNSGAVRQRYTELHGPVELQVAAGQGHTMWRGFFECGPLVDFVIRTAGGAGK